MSVNTVILQGYVAQDPKSLHEAISQFTLAVNDTWKDERGNWQERTNFVRVKCFGRLAKRAMEKIRKSDFITVEGSLRTEEWVKDGNTISETKVVAKSLPDCHLRKHKETKAHAEQLDSFDQAMDEPAPPQGFDKDEELPF